MARVILMALASAVLWIFLVIAIFTRPDAGRGKPNAEDRGPDPYVG